MTDTAETDIDRRTALTALAGSGLAALAGCLGGDDDTDDDIDDTADDGEDVTRSLDEAPEGEALSAADIELLVDIFDDEPMNADQMEISGEDRDYTPAHVWKWVSDETFIALHFNDPNPEQADALNWIAVGKKGLFTEESKPGEEFTHFHQHTADSWEAGHGGEGGEEGYWLTHIAVDSFEAPQWEVEEEGVDYDFMPTPTIEEEGHTTDFTSPGGDEGSLSAADRDALLEVFDDNWVNDAQREIDGENRDYTPAHVWKWVNDDVLLFLHFDSPNPENADDLIYFGIGTRGQFRDADRPGGPRETDGEDFTHFHLHDAESWEAGHGGEDPDQHGLWLVHHAVRPLEMPWGDVEVGVDRNFNRTPPQE